jgi:trans-2,3-dihydro-3-hydroxyanthranilate isomerase
MLGYEIWDVFTEAPFAGNPLAIVRGAESLSDRQMLTLAREFNLSETIFVMPPRDGANTARVRIFFPTAEIPFAGHPTIGCAIHLALEGRGQADFKARIVLEEEAGLVPVQVERRSGRVTAEFVAPVLPHGVDGTVEAGLLAQALDLAPEDMGFGRHEAAVWAGGPCFVYAPVSGLKALGRARPVQPYWDRVMTAAGVDSVYLYTRGPDCDYRARMFSPTAGIPEDPATGSATAILAAQLLESGALGEGETVLTLAQGVEMGRESRLGLTVRVQEGRLEQVRVKGSAVRIAGGQIRVPGLPDANDQAM